MVYLTIDDSRSILKNNSIKKGYGINHSHNLAKRNKNRLSLKFENKSSCQETPDRMICFHSGNIFRY